MDQLSKYCNQQFPYFMLTTTGYRASIMLFSALNAFQAGKKNVFLIILSIGLLMGYLDKGWTSYFLGILGWPSKVRYRTDPTDFNT